MYLQVTLILVAGIVNAEQFSAGQCDEAGVAAVPVSPGVELPGKCPGLTTVPGYAGTDAQLFGVAVAISAHDRSGRQFDEERRLAHKGSGSGTDHDFPSSDE